MNPVSLTPIKIGQHLKPISIERVKFSERNPTVLSILSMEILGAHTHYKKGIGEFFCFRGSCCTICGLPRLKYVFPVLEYNTRTVQDFGTPVFVKYLSLGAKDYESIVMKNEIAGDITAKDIVAVCSDEGFQSCTYDVLGDAKWKTDSTMVAEVKAQYSEYKKLISMSVARSIDHNQFVGNLEPEEKTVLGSSAAPAQQQTPPQSSTLDLGSVVAAQETAKLVAPDDSIIDSTVLPGVELTKETKITTAVADEPPVVNTTVEPVGEINLDDLLG